MRRLWNAIVRLREQLTDGQFAFSVETLVLAASLFFALFCNDLFFESMLAGHDLTQPKSWLFGASLFVALTGAHFFLLGLVANRWIAKPLLALLLLATAFAAYFMQRYHVYLDPTMLRNVLATDVREAGDLLTWALIPHLLLYAAIPIWILRHLRIELTPLRRAFAVRIGALALALVAVAVAIFISYQDFATLMRNNKSLRFLVTPGNYIYSLAWVARGNVRVDAKVRTPIGTDAQPGASWAAGRKPVVMVLFLGETVRAANWGLSGYARQTTPELAEAGVLNFAQVTSCGTNTETSVPCIFSPWGRRQYDEERIRGSESLLDVVARAGFRVVWIDNQSGCKGVCDGVESIKPDPAATPESCPEGVCQDEAMWTTLDKVIGETPGNLLVVMHAMGNHGPAYFKRYPPAFKHYAPACEDADLTHCTSEAIVNAYDNAIRYTDHVIAGAIGQLRAQGREAALLYVSDHGESLGEKGLFLHGVPYAIAPDVQTRVPMVWWRSASFDQGASLDADCLARQSTRPQSHDHVFHTLLGLLDVTTAVYAPEMDFSASCRKTPAQK